MFQISPMKQQQVISLLAALVTFFAIVGCFFSDRSLYILKDANKDVRHSHEIIDSQNNKNFDNNNSNNNNHNLRSIHSLTASNTPFAVLLNPWFHDADGELSCAFPLSQRQPNNMSDSDRYFNDQTFSTNYMVPYETKMCLVVVFIASHHHNEFSGDTIQVDLSLISHKSLIAPKLKSCSEIKSNSSNIRYACSYSITFTETGIYNVSMRGDYFLIPTKVSSTGPFDGLGDYMGRFRELRTLGLQQIVVRKNHLKIAKGGSSFSVQVNNALPYCTFQHELQMWQQGLGNQQWKRVVPGMDIETERSLRKLWYNDTYIWSNDICQYRPFSGENILDAMDRKNISKVLFVGDSLTRFMWGDFEDQFSHCTQEWLLQNPIILRDNANGQSLTSWDNALSGAGGFGAYFNKTGQCFHQNGIIPLQECCRNNSCANRNCIFVIHQFLPGFMGPAQPELIVPPKIRTVEEWEVLFKAYIDDEWPQLPNIVVFNAGLWLINAYRDNSISELEKIIAAWMKLCRLHNIRFVWRSTFYHHRALSMNRLIKKTNDAAIKFLINNYNHTMFLSSNYYMSMLRPDRTVDGFHYNYRMLRSAWHRCTQDDFKNIDPDCVRDMSWPMSVAKAASLSLVNIILNSLETT